MRLNRMKAIAACCHFPIFIGSFLYQCAKPPQGIVLFINLLGKGLTPRACMGDAGSIWCVPGCDDCQSVSQVLKFTYLPISIFIFTLSPLESPIKLWLSPIFHHLDSFIIILVSKYRPLKTVGGVGPRFRGLFHVVESGLVTTIPNNNCVFNHESFLLEAAIASS